MSAFDLLPGLFTGLLGEPVVYTPAGGSPVTIDAIVDWNPMVVTPFEGPGTNVSRVVAHVRGEDLAAAPAGGTLITAAKPWLGATTWKIVEPISPDGQGMTLLTLERTA